MKDSDYFCLTLSTRYLSIYDVHRLWLVSKCFSGLLHMIYETNIPISIENYFTEVLKIKVDEASTPSYGYHDIRIISMYYPNISILVLYEHINSCPYNNIDVMLNYLRRQKNLSDLTIRDLRIEGLFDLLIEEDFPDHYNPPLIKLTRLHLYKVSIHSNKVFECLIRSCQELKNLSIEMCMNLDIHRILFLFQLPQLEQLTIDSCYTTGIPLELSFIFGTRLSKLKIVNCPQFTLCSFSGPTFLASTNIKYCDLSNTAMVAVALERLVKHSPLLTILIVAFCRNLGEILRVKANNLEVLDLRATHLKQLSITSPVLRSLRLTLCLKLTELSIKSSILHILDLKSLPLLSDLTIECLALKTLDLTGCRSIQKISIIDEVGFSSCFISFSKLHPSNPFLNNSRNNCNNESIHIMDKLLSNMSIQSVDQINEETNGNDGHSDGNDIGWTLIDLFDQIDRLLPQLDYADFIYHCIGGSSLAIYQQDVINQYISSTSIDVSQSSDPVVRSIEASPSSSSSSSIKTPIISEKGSNRNAGRGVTDRQLNVRDSSSDKKTKKNPRRRRSSL